MATVIKTENRAVLRGQNPLMSLRLIKSLPSGLVSEIEDAACAMLPSEHIEEIRLRCGRRVYLTVGGRGSKKNIALSRILTRDELGDVLDRMCDGSLYAYSESITNGYVSLGDGIRVGVCGRASVDNGRVLGVYDISALNIRLPCREVRLDGSLVSQIRKTVLCGKGVLIYSPPAEGKTTMLRSLAPLLAGGTAPIRIALVDARDELGNFDGRSDLAIDILNGYPKAEGIRIATAFLSPQAVMCDEIGADEADAIAEAQNCGVGLIATAHGSDVEGILKRGGMARLHAVEAFALYVGIRISTGGGFDCRIQKREEIALADNRNDHGLC